MQITRYVVPVVRGFYMLSRALVCIFLFNISAMIACQSLEEKKAKGNPSPAQTSISQPPAKSEMMQIKFFVPALSDFKTARGDGSGLITHYAYRLEAADPACVSAQASNVLNYTGAHEERLMVPRLCAMRLSVAMGNSVPSTGQGFQPMFDTNQPIIIEPKVWLAGREAAINYTLNRVAAGQAAGFTASEVNVAFPLSGPSVPGQTTTTLFGQVPTTTLPGGSTTSPDGKTVEFRIKAGTGRGAWNTAATAITAKVGQVVRIINDDSVVHQLHTNGAPCSHGNPIPPGATGTCIIERPYSGEPLYDHGTNGPVYISAQ